MFALETVVFPPKMHLDHGSSVGYLAIPHMGTGASKARPGDSAARYVAEEASNASEEALANAFTGLSDSERQRVMEALHTANMSKATTSGTVCLASCGVSGTVGMAKSSFRMWC